MHIGIPNSLNGRIFCILVFWLVHIFLKQQQEFHRKNLALLSSTLPFQTTIELNPSTLELLGGSIGGNFASAFHHLLQNVSTPVRAKQNRSFCWEIQKLTVLSYNDGSPTASGFQINRSSRILFGKFHDIFFNEFSEKQNVRCSKLWSLGND